MLKITISASLLKTVSSALMAVSSEAAIQQKEHPFIISQEKKSLERRAKMWEKSVEEIIKEDEEFAAKYPSKSFIEKLPLISNIKAYTDKVFKIDVDAASKELTVEINEDFIAEAIKIGTNVTVKAMEPALNLAAVFANYGEDVVAYKAKWDEDKVDSTITSETIPAEKVPEEIRAKVKVGHVETEGWTLAIDQHPSKPKPFFPDEEKEAYISCVDLICTRGEEQFNCYPSDGVGILQSKDKTVAQLAQYNEMPASLIKAIYAYYGVELTPKQLGIEEVQAPAETPLSTEDVIQKAFDKAFDNASAAIKE